MSNMVIMPEMPKHLASPTLAAAWQLRAEANATGVCPSCHVEMQMPNRAERRRAKATGTIPKAHMYHESWCTVGNDGIARAVRTGMN